MSLYAHITGWGMAVPRRVLTNDELSQIVDTNDEWIRSRTGIGQRHIASEEESTATLGYDASVKALQVARLKPDELDLIIVATSSPEHIFPATACIIQDRLGAKKAGAFDLLAACTGFIYALNIATQTIRSGAARNALVVGAETLSRFVDWKDRNTCVLFGDGAGAFVLQGREEIGGVLSAVMRSDGSGGDLLTLPGGGSRYPATLESVREGLHYIRMNGRGVFRFATRVMAQATQDAVEQANMKIEDIELVIPHQANYRIIETAMRSLKVPMERCLVNLENYGNTSTASIPIAVCEAASSGRLQPGHRVVFVGFGAGLTWGAAMAIWSGPTDGRKEVLPASYRFYTRLRSLARRILRRIEAFIWGRRYPSV